jgi:hypothetical protein
MNETQPTQGDNDQVIVALEGDAGNLEKLVTLARECGFRKLLSALVKDLQKAQAEKIEIIAMAADVCRDMSSSSAARLAIRRSIGNAGGLWPSRQRIRATARTRTVTPIDLCQNSKTLRSSASRGSAAFWPIAPQIRPRGIAARIRIAMVQWKRCATRPYRSAEVIDLHRARPPSEQ